MKSMLRTFANILVPAVLVSALAVAPAAAQDKAKAPEKAKAAPAAADKGKAAVTPGTTKTLVENDKVKVTEVTFKPGEGGPARERPPRVVRALSDGTMERTYPDGKTEKVEWKTGQVRYFSKDTFGNKNVGKTDVVLYVVETK